MGRKEEILDALVQKLTIQGFSTDFTMSEIANSVNIGKSTIYEYFSNKDDMLKAAMIKFIKDNVKKLYLEEDIDSLSFEELFKLQMHKLLSVASESRSMLETFQSSFVEKFPTSMKEEMKKTLEETKALVEGQFMKYFMKGVEEGLVAPDITPTKAYIVASLVIGSIIRYSDPVATIDINEFVDELYIGVLKLSQ